MECITIEQRCEILGQNMLHKAIQLKSFYSNYKTVNTNIITIIYCQTLRHINGPSGSDNFRLYTHIHHFSFDEWNFYCIDQGL